MTVASSLKKLFAASGTVGKAARELDIARPSLSKVINGGAALSIDLALKIEAAYGIDARRMLIRQLDEQIGKTRARHLRPRP